MILIADSGSTKTEWVLIRQGDEADLSFVTSGTNPAVMPEAQLAEAFAEVIPYLEGRTPRSLFFYGAGCLPHLCDVTAGLLRSVLGINNVEVNSDLLGATRALLGSEQGIACILGTGSNSCLYNGREIEANTSPLGYILGDEGSGAVLGKLLAGNVLKRQLPEDLCRSFLEEYHLDAAEIINRVYRQPAANRFLASFAPFIRANIERPEIRAMVCTAFRDFFNRNLRQYPGYGSLPASFCGSIAHHFAPQLREVAAEVGCPVGEIVQKPIQGLARYHRPR